MEGDYIIKDNKFGKHHVIEFNSERLRKIFNNEIPIYDKFDIFKDKLNEKEVLLIIDMVHNCIIDIR